MADNFDVARFIEDKTAEIKDKIGSETVIVLVSGGKDSSTTLALIARALPYEQVVPVALGMGLGHERQFLRLKAFTNSLAIPLKIWECAEEFSPAMREKTILGRRKVFRRIYGKTIRKLAKAFSATFFAQGTIAPDIEMRHRGQEQHNPKLEIPGLTALDPLAELGKEEARLVGDDLGVLREILTDMPFPGPGYLLRKIDGEALFPGDTQLLEKLNEVIYQFYPDRAHQAFAVLGPRLEDGYCILVNAVLSEDCMVANPELRDLEMLDKTLREASPQVKAVYIRLTPKPPLNIEWG